MVIEQTSGAKQRFDARQFLVRAIVGLVFALLAAAPVCWLVVLRDQVPNRAQQFVLYVCLAIIAGLVFTAASISTGQINWKRLGISLSGGAAIGIATIFVVDGLLPPVPTPAVIQPSTTGLVSCAEHGAGIRVTRINNSSRYLVERELGEYNKQESRVIFEIFRSDPSLGSGRESISYLVTAEGRLIREEVNDDEP